MGQHPEEYVPVFISRVQRGLILLSAGGGQVVKERQEGTVTGQK